MSEETLLTSPVVKKKKSGSRVFSLLKFLVVSAVLIAGALFLVKTKPELLGLAKGDAVVRAELKDLVDKVGKLMSLPEDEEPTIATVTDIEKVKDQPFFQKAQNGDKVLIYTNAKKAILFRPSENKIIDVGALNIKDQASTQTPAPTEPFKVALYNGTSTGGLTNSYEEALKSRFPTATVTVKQNAANTSYPESVIVDLSGKNKALADQLSETFGFPIRDFPEGETRPAADILIILGKNSVSE